MCPDFGLLYICNVVTEFLLSEKFELHINKQVRIFFNEN
jgi:hypothetical protein